MTTTADNSVPEWPIDDSHMFPAFIELTPDELRYIETSEARIAAIMDELTTFDGLTTDGRDRFDKLAREVGYLRGRIDELR